MNKTKNNIWRTSFLEEKLTKSKLEQENKRLGNFRNSGLHPLSWETVLFRFSACTLKRSESIRRETFLEIELPRKWLKRRKAKTLHKIWNFVRIILLALFQSHQTSTPSNIHVFWRLQRITDTPNRSNLVVTTHLVHAWPLQIPCVIQSLCHLETPRGRQDSTPPWQSNVQLSCPLEEGRQAEVAIIEFSANTTVSSVRDCFYNHSICIVSKTSFAAKKLISRSGRFSGATDRSTWQLKFTRKPLLGKSNK